MNRLTALRCNGIKTGYWSAAKKEDLVQRLAAYENTGLEPKEVQSPGTGWISVEKELPNRFEPVLLCRPYSKTEIKVEQGVRDMGDWWKVYGARTKKVTHWMPLPEPPKEAE